MYTKRKLILGSLLLLVLAACGQSLQGPSEGTTPDEDEIIIPETTEVLDEGSRDALLEVGEDGTLTFDGSAGLAAELEEDDVVVSEPTDAAPHGLLRKVVSVREEGGLVVVETEGAEIREAIHQGSLSVELELNESDLEQSIALQSGITVQSFSHTLDTDFGTGGRLEAIGTIEIDPSIDLDLGVKCDRKVLGVCAEIPDLEVLVRLGMDETASLELRGDQEFDFDEELPVAQHAFAPITFSIGPVPVVLTPLLELYLTASGSLSAHLSFEVEQNLTLAGGFEFESGSGFTNISENEASFDDSGVQFGGTAEAQAAAGGKFELLLYGVVGPFGSLEAGPQLEANQEGLPGSGTTLWRLQGCVTATVGINTVDVLDLSYDTELFDACAGFASDGNTAPIADIETPRPDIQLFEGDFVTLRANARDPDGHVVDCEWSSDEPSDPLPVSTCETQVQLGTVGERTLTVTATDPAGASDSASVTIDVQPEPEIVVTIHNPGPGSSFGPSDEIALSGQMSGGNAPYQYEWSGELIDEDGDNQLVTIATGTTSESLPPLEHWTPEDDLDGLEGTFSYDFVLTLEVTDDNGVVGSRDRTLEIFNIVID